MADITLSSGSTIRPYRSPWGAFPIARMLESTGQSFRTGYVLQIDTNVATSAGRVAAYSTNSTSIVGVAAEAASSVYNQAIPVYEANPMVEFRGNTKTALTSTMVGTESALAFDSSLAIYYLNIGNSTAADHRVVITELIDAAGDTNGAVAFRFKGAFSHLYPSD